MRVSRRVSFCLAFDSLQPRSVGADQRIPTDSPSGPTGILVHSQFGGQIFGFDIDQNGTEGILAEAKSLSNGNVLAAVETFDQASGRILHVVELTLPTHAQDDFITLGVVGNSVGLVEHENVSGGFVTTPYVQRVEPAEFGTALPAPGHRLSERSTSSCLAA
jgi:hypothetical protein